VTGANRAELLIDGEEDRSLRAALIGMLRSSRRLAGTLVAGEPAPHDDPAV
jgi:hypothetical protein